MIPMQLISKASAVLMTDRQTVKVIGEGDRTHHEHHNI